VQDEKVYLMSIGGFPFPNLRAVSLTTQELTVFSAFRSPEIGKGFGVAVVLLPIFQFSHQAFEQSLDLFSARFKTGSDPDKNNPDNQSDQPFHKRMRLTE
jgi:hypothetical protein